MKRRLIKLFLHLFYRRLWTQIAPVIFLAAVIPLILLGVILINTSQSAVRNSVLSNHKQIASLAAEEISLFVKRAEDILMTTEAILSVQYPAPWKQETILVELILDQPIFIRAVSVDLTGNPIASSELGRGLSWKYPNDIIKSASQGNVYISEVKMLDNSTPYITMAVPIKKQGKQVGILAADVNLRGVWDIVDNIKLGATGTALLVSGKGDLIAHHDKKLVLKSMGLSRQKDVRLALAGETGAMELNASRDRLISSYAPVSETGWGIVLRQTQDEAYYFSKVMRWQSWVMILASLILAILISVFLARFLTRPVKALVSRIKGVAAGDLDCKLEVKKRDEIGELIRSFNDMTGKLKKAHADMRLSAIGEAAGWITHELKNSLMLVKSLVNTFPARHKDEDFAAKFARLMPPEISRWERLLNELSGLSSQNELRLARIDLVETLSSTIEMFCEKFLDKKIEPYLEVSERPIFIRADQERLKQVFLNLIINAADAMPDGGRLIVSAGSMQPKERSRSVQIRIKDTGKGIGEESIARIFEPFYTTSSNGSGLGLAIARKIVEQHKGTIKVESKPGSGTTFIIELPTE